MLYIRVWGSKERYVCCTCIPCKPYIPRNMVQPLQNLNCAFSRISSENISTKNETKISITIFRPSIFFLEVLAVWFFGVGTTTTTLPSRHVGSAFQPWWRRFKVPKDTPMMSRLIGPILPLKGWIYEMSWLIGSIGTWNPNIPKWPLFCHKKKVFSNQTRVIWVPGV